MAAELAQVHGRSARWRFAAGCARAASLPPHGSRAVVLVVVVVAVAATAATALATGAALPAMRVFALTFVALAGGLAVLTVARSRRVRHAGPGPVIAGLALAGIAACIASTGYYLAEYPFYHRVHPPATSVSLPPVTAVVLAIVLVGCLWLALTPPRWLLGGRPARRVGLGMAVALVVGFVLTSRLALRGVAVPDGRVTGYLILAPIVVLLPGSAVAAAVGWSFRSGLQACAWAAVLGTPMVVVAWLAEALRWYQQGRGLFLDGDGGFGVGANLDDAIWWTLGFVVVWALPLGMIGAAVGSWAMPQRGRNLGRRLSTRGRPVAR
jgi:hypothetical protein